MKDKYKIAVKVERVIRSCRNYEQLCVDIEMVKNYEKTFGENVVNLAGIVDDMFIRLRYQRPSLPHFLLKEI